MTTIRDQVPRSGCCICGGPVRTRKDGKWICWRCHRERMRPFVMPADTASGRAIDRRERLIWRA